MSAPGAARVREAALDLRGSAAAAAVLVRERLVEPTRPLDTLRTARDTERLGPVAAVVRRGARRHPDAVALLDDDGELTYGALDAASEALAQELLAVLPEDRPLGAPSVVGLLARDHRGAVVALGAAGLVGLRVVLLNTGSAAPQLAAVLEREGVALVLHDEGSASVVAEALGSSPAPRPGALLLDGAEGFLARAAADPRRQRSPLPLPRRSGGLVVMTSGTTGVPKGAPRGRVSPLQSAQVLDRLPFPRGGTVVMAAPVFHGTGLSQLVLALAAGCRVVLARRFDAARCRDTIAATRADALVLVPTMLHRLLALDPDPAALASLTRVYAAGSVLPADLCRRTHALLGPVLHNMYGSTEVGVAAVARPDELALAPGCVGRPPAGARIRVLDADRRPVARGERGTIFVRSLLAFGGYTDGSGKEVVDGYVSTGDVGHVDAHGLLHVDGREDDMIVSGGENVMPGRVEALLAAHPDVDEAVVVGVPDEEFGQRLRAVVVPRPGSAPDPDALRALARERLARHEVPREVWIVDVLPRNATGKVLRRLLVAAASPADVVPPG
ncbi:AMP-binding protein [Nocardioides sp. TRM66260-LWL]|uniref:AMP-binding protein n=1 Tax=Nocardioides sp. TRM66260-LWL TaxID=2874478 RepID=UPI001CC5AD0B|nr:AMP-binding protein [Nocardioides sp. TRM66260-LWL]MBZ5736045.1 AMP-binding protein [Nocardioides sp. TRM66260-LWL]